MKHLFLFLLLIVKIQSIAQINNPPIAVDDCYETEVGIPIMLTPLLNDTDPNGDILTLWSIGPSTNGIVTNVSGTITFTPNSGFIGIESFSYSISDGTLISSGLITIDVAIKEIVVNGDGSIKFPNRKTHPTPSNNKFYVLNNEPYFGTSGLKSQLEKITEGGNTGWRLLGSDPNKYGDIGSNAIDLSINNFIISNIHGATGNSSFASGVATKARGYGSSAIGNGTNAIGANSFAAGQFTSSIGDNSSAIGFGSEAKGVSSAALGNYSLASSFASVSIGQYSDTIAGSNRNVWVDTDPLLVLGNGNVSIGWRNAMTVYKNGTFDLQNHTSTPDNNTNKFYVLNNEPYFGSSGLKSQLEKITEGSNTGWRLAGRNPDHYGNIGSNAVDFSINELPSATKGATGNASFVAGYSTTASNLYTTALGYNTMATGSISTALGNGSNASGNFSLAANNSWASGQNATSFNQAQAHGENSFATGNGYVGSTGTNAAGIAGGGAFGVNAVALGVGTHAVAYSSTAVGRYNDGFFNTANRAAWVNTDPLFMIGNGADENNRRNAMFLRKDGRVGFGTSDPYSQFDIICDPAIGGSNRVTLGNRGGFGAMALDFVSDYGNNTNVWRPGYIVSADAGSYTGKLEFYTNGTGSGNKWGNVKALEINNGTTYTATGTVASWSDARLKENIKPFTDGLDVIKKINPKTFNYKENAPFSSDKNHVGIIAQELEKVAPYMVDITGTKELEDARSVNNQAYTFLLINAIKELAAKVDEQQKIIDGLNTKVDAQASVLSEISDLKKEFESLKIYLESKEANGR